MSKKRGSLSIKLSLDILLMAAPVFVLVLGALSIHARYIIRQEAMDRTNSVLNTTLQRVRNYMSAVETATNANTWLVMENFQPDSLLAISRRIVRLNRHINGCSITAEPDMFPRHGRYFSAYTIREGDSVITAREAEYDYYNKVWYKTPRQLGEACWVDPFDDYNEGTLCTTELIASYCKPLCLEGDHIVGVISTDLSFSRLTKTINDTEQPYPNAYFFLVGSDGRYLMHPDTTRLFKKTIFTDADLNNQTDMIALGYEMIAGKQGSMKVTIDGKLFHVCFCPVPSTSWSLALACPDSDVLKSYHQLAYIIIALIIIGLLVILLLCRWLVSRAIRPLDSLLSMSQYIADGHYDETIPRVDRKDVIGLLQNSFATMQQSLREYVGSIREATEETRERNEELARATQLAEKAVRQKTTFIQNMSHQIRTPLNIITGFAQVLCDSIRNQGQLPEEDLTGIVDMMEYNATHLNRMVLMLYDSSDTGISKELQTHRDDLISCNKLAQECIDYTWIQFPDLPIRLETELADDFRIRTNHLYLMRTLRELLYNSAKYSDGQHLSIRILRTESTVRFIVEDVGPGLGNVSQDVIFKPFTKADDLSEGLGLGLPLAKQHAIGLGGDLTYDPSYQEGCRFIVEVPISD